jgi:hypothetical protein
MVCTTRTGAATTAGSLSYATYVIAATLEVENQRGGAVLRRGPGVAGLSGAGDLPEARPDSRVCCKAGHRPVTPADADRSRPDSAPLAQQRRGEPEPAWRRLLARSGHWTLPALPARSTW